MLMQLISVLAWLAIPAALICVIDDWLLRPRRQIAAAPQPARDPPLMAVVYYALPVLVVAGVVELLLSERLDFSLVLLLIAVVTGVFWLLDVLVLSPARTAAAVNAGKDPNLVSEPGTVDYARSFFPVAVVVLVLRSFVFEPFRIPSDSMMPTLLDGDFIIVNKYAYGLRLPVINKKIVPIGEPQRGDVVVFRYPPDPSINYIKRLVGLPGDRVQVHDDKLIVNGKPVQTVDLGLYDDGCYQGMRLAQEQLGEHRHEIMFCPTPGDIAVEPLPTCNRHQSRSYVCVASQSNEVPDRGDWPEHVIPPGSYLMIGDNRDNSADGRYFGFVPEDNLVGKATRIWFNWDLQRSGGPVWSRIGRAIQ
jgi:signal peptidase I